MKIVEENVFSMYLNRSDIRVSEFPLKTNHLEHFILNSKIDACIQRNTYSQNQY